MPHVVYIDSALSGVAAAGSVRLRLPMSPLLADYSNNPIRALPLRLRTQQWHQLEAIARTLDRSRNEVIEELLHWAEEAWRKDATPAQVASYEKHLKAVQEEATSAPMKKTQAKK